MHKEQEFFQSKSGKYIRWTPYKNILYFESDGHKVVAKDREEKGVRRSIPGSISFVPPTAGLLIAGEAVRDLLGIS